MKKILFSLIIIIASLLLASCGHKFQIDKNAKSFLNFSRSTNDTVLEGEAYTYESKIKEKLKEKRSKNYTYYQYEKYNINNINYEFEMFYDSIENKRNDIIEKNKTYSKTNNNITEYYSYYTYHLNRDLKAERSSGEIFENDKLTKTTDSEKLIFIKKEYDELEKEPEFDIFEYNFKIFDYEYKNDLYKQDDFDYLKDEKGFIIFTLNTKNDISNLYYKLYDKDIIYNINFKEKLENNKIKTILSPIY